MDDSSSRCLSVTMKSAAIHLALAIDRLTDFSADITIFSYTALYLMPEIYKIIMVSFL